MPWTSPGVLPGKSGVGGFNPTGLVGKMVIYMENQHHFFMGKSTILPMETDLFHGFSVDTRGFTMKKWGFFATNGDFTGDLPLMDLTKGT